MDTTGAKNKCSKQAIQRDDQRVSYWKWRDFPVRRQLGLGSIVSTPLSLSLSHTHTHTHTKGKSNHVSPVKVWSIESIWIGRDMIIIIHFEGIISLPASNGCFL